MKRIGKIEELYRYPVKSFQGEAVPMLEVKQYGIDGDRSHVFIDHSRADKHLSAKQVPELLGYTAKYIDASSEEIVIHSPQGKLLEWDEQLLKEVEQLSGKKLSLYNFKSNQIGLRAVDAEPILITSIQSLAIAKKVLHKALDFRRFRPNIVINLDHMLQREEENEQIIELDYVQDSQDVFPDFSLVGKSLRLGSVTLEVTDACERCSMVNVHPEKLTSDPQILKELIQRYDGCFGVYARVVETGMIQEDDDVFLVE